MNVVLLTVGLVLLIGAVTAALALARRHQVIGPLVAGVLGVVLLGLSLAGTGHHPGPPLAVQSPQSESSVSPQAAPSETATEAPSDPSGCRAAPPVRRSAKYPGRPPLPLPGPNAFEKLPAQLAPGPPDQGELVEQGNPVVMGPYFDASAIDTVSPSLVNVTSAGYTDLALGDQGGIADVFIAVGLPKSDDCWYQLPYAVIDGSTWTSDATNIRQIPAGPVLSSVRAVLECGQQESWLNECAWAGPGTNGSGPVFGVVNILPNTRLHLGSYTAAQMSTWIDHIFTALTTERH